MRRMGEQMRKLVGPKGPYNLLNNIYCPQPISPLVYNSVEANQEDKERVYMTSELGSKKESGAPSPETEAFLPNGGNNQTANISSWVKLVINSIASKFVIFLIVRVCFVFGCVLLCIRECFSFFFVFHAKSVTINNHRTGSSDISY